ncbi:MAG: Uncharacterized protein G01um10143_307 [Parcubacteria group bacterium Gr01-1014_3]|nr:MAG: Uncharacterized protein G01um10143_307 [Parcubacteria group bacterium Gr01-1014_3]
MGHNFYCSKECQGRSFNKQVSFVCENTECGAEFKKFRKEVGAHNYCSMRCAAIVNNKKFPKHVIKLKICRICEKQFTGGNIYCANVCYKKSRVRHKPEDLIKSLKHTYEKLGRVPAKREIPELASPCIYAFGSWGNAIKAAGLEPNRSHEHRMYKRTMTKAKDGHSCDSISEALIDNWLSDNEVKHLRDFPYPNSGHKADWAINDTLFIEYFGLAGDSPRYDRDMKIKKKICEKLGIRLVAIYPQDLYPKLNLNSKLKNLS